MAMRRRASRRSCSSHVHLWRKRGQWRSALDLVRARRQNPTTAPTPRAEEYMAGIATHVHEDSTVDVMFDSDGTIECRIPVEFLLKEPSQEHYVATASDTVAEGSDDGPSVATRPAQVSQGRGEQEREESLDGTSIIQGATAADAVKNNDHGNKSETRQEGPDEGEEALGANLEEQAKAAAAVTLQAVYRGHASRSSKRKNAKGESENENETENEMKEIGLDAESVFETIMSNESFSLLVCTWNMCGKRVGDIPANTLETLLPKCHHAYFICTQECGATAAEALYAKKGQQEWEIAIRAHLGGNFLSAPRP